MNISFSKLVSHKVAPSLQDVENMLKTTYAELYANTVGEP